MIRFHPDGRRPCWSKNFCFFIHFMPLSQNWDSENILELDKLFDLRNLNFILTAHLDSKSILERLNLVKSKSISRESSEYPTVEKSVPPIGTRIILKWLNHWFSSFSLVFRLRLWYEIKAESVRAPPKPIISCSNGPSKLIEDDLSFNLDEWTFSILTSDWSIRFPLRELVWIWTRPADPDQKGVVSSQ